MAPAGFERAFPASKRPQNHPLYPTATGISCRKIKRSNCVLLINIFTFLFRVVTLQPNSDRGRLVVEASAAHTIRHTHPVGISERVVSSKQRQLPKRHNINTGEEHPWFQRELYPRSQQSSDRKPTPQTARPLGSHLHLRVLYIAVFYLYLWPVHYTTYVFSSVIFHLCQYQPVKIGLTIHSLGSRGSVCDTIAFLLLHRS
jgi:hypothetical protein